MKYYDTKLKGAYMIELSYGGDTYKSWCVDGDLNKESEKLIDLVIELWSLCNCKEVRDELYEDINWEFVEKNNLPPEIYQALVNEESYLVEEVDYAIW